MAFMTKLFSFKFLRCISPQTMQILVLTGQSSNLCDACRKHKKHSLCALVIFVFVSVSNDPFKQKAVAWSKHFSNTHYYFLHFPLTALGPSGELLVSFSASCMDVTKRLILYFPPFYHRIFFSTFLLFTSRRTTWLVTFI